MVRLKIIHFNASKRHVEKLAQMSSLNPNLLTTCEYNFTIYPQLTYVLFFFFVILLFFILGSISNIDDAEYHCNKTQVRKVISGVVGAASSVTSIQVANLLRLFRIPQVSNEN